VSNGGVSHVSEETKELSVQFVIVKKCAARTYLRRVQPAVHLNTRFIARQAAGTRKHRHLDPIPCRN
jgi:hypothetical protein